MCSDPRDRNYAILGHITFERDKQAAGGMPLIVADCSKPVSDVYLEVAIELLELPNPYYILSMVEHTDFTIDDHGVVSWAPQWISYYGVHELAGLKSPGVFYGACGSSTPKFQIHKRMLALEGVILDRIKWSSTQFYGWKSDKKIDSVIRRIPDELMCPDYGLNGSVKRNISNFLSTIYGGVQSKLIDNAWADRDVNELHANFAAYIHNNGIDPRVGNAFGTEYADGTADQFLVDITSLPFSGRFFFISENGYLGLGPPVSQSGDRICFFFGVQVPFILRPQHDSGEYRLCGECYVDGMMYGEIADMLKSGKVKEETFRLV